MLDICCYTSDDRSHIFLCDGIRVRIDSHIGGIIPYPLEELVFLRAFVKKSAYGKCISDGGVFHIAIHADLTGKLTDSIVNIVSLVDEMGIRFIATDPRAGGRTSPTRFTVGKLEDIVNGLEGAS